MNSAWTMFSLLLVSMLGSGCASQKSGDGPKTAGSGSPAALAMAENRSHPLAKHIELVGFRLSEKSQGKLNVQVIVVNHSNADIADLGMNVSLKPANAGADEPGFCTFSLKVPSLGPRAMADTTVECSTTLRIYELPDWQFIRPVYQITSPTL